MSSSHATPRRSREPGDRNRNLYRRYDGRFEVGYRNSTGRQRWTRAYDIVSALRATQKRARDRNGQARPSECFTRASEYRAAPFPASTASGTPPQVTHWPLGDTAEEVSWMLRHKTPAVTRAIYLHEVSSAERDAQARASAERRAQYLRH